MSIHFRCIDCYAVLGISDSQAGKGVTCPRCRYRQVVPFRSDPTIAQLHDERPVTGVPCLLAESDDSLAELLASPTRAHDTKPRVPWLLLTSSGAIGALVLCGMIVFSWIQDRQSRRTAMARAVSVPVEEPKSNAPGTRLQAVHPTVDKNQTSSLPPIVGTADHKHIEPLATRNAGVAKPRNSSEVAVSVAKAKSPTTNLATKRADNRKPSAEEQPRPMPAPPVKIQLHAPKNYSQTELLAQLGKIKKHSLEMDAETRRIVAAEFRITAIPRPLDLGPLLPKGQEAKAIGLPLNLGSECFLDEKRARALAISVRKLRGALTYAKQKKARSVPAAYEKYLRGEGTSAWKECDVRAGAQMLQVEDESLRRRLINALAKSPDEFALDELARRAVFDVSPKLRELARVKLKTRLTVHSRRILVRYTQHPWFPAAAHAAQVLVSLRVSDAVPELIDQLRDPDVTIPRFVDQEGELCYAVPRMVRINHLNNCLLCHAPLLRRDLTTSGSRSFRAGQFPVGAVPHPDQSIPPATSSAYYLRGDLFVRADVTYLRQDFSIMQEVKNHGRWPKMQRFDFVARMQPITKKEADSLRQQYRKNGLSPQRRAQLWALQQLTGVNAGTTYAHWLPLLYKEGG